MKWLGLRRSCKDDRREGRTCFDAWKMSWSKRDAF